MITTFNTTKQENSKINGVKCVIDNQPTMLHDILSSKRVKIEKVDGKQSQNGISDHGFLNGTSSGKDSFKGSKSTSGNIKVDPQTNTVRIINHNQDFYLNKQSTKRSKKGCLTCKCRKKKCNEERPICSDCRRLSKNCIWVDDNMDDEEVKKLKEKVEHEESNRKMRKRKSKKQNIVDNDDEKKIKKPKSDLDIPDKQSFPIRTSDSHFTVSLPNSNPIPIDQIRSRSVNIPNHLLETLEPPKARSLDFPFESLSTNIHQLPNGISNPNTNTMQDDGLKLTPSTINLLNTASTNDLLSTSFNFNSSSQIFETNLNESGIRFTKSYRNENSSTPPMMEQKNVALDSPDPLKSFKYFQQQSPNSPTISNLMNPVDENKLGNEAAQKSFSLDNDQPTQPEKLSDLIDNKSADEYNTFANSPSVFLNFLMDLKHYEPKFQLLDDVTPNQADSNTQHSEDQLVPFSNFASLSPNNYGHLMDEIQNIMTPLPFCEPSYIPDLSSSTANYLYNYYEHTLSKHVSIAPKSQNESNSYQKVFLPLAHKDPGVLYAILGWAGHHLGGDWIKEGFKYSRLAANHLSKSMFGVDDYNKSPLGHNATKSTVLFNNREDTNSIIIKLATLLILCGSEICRGDVKNWSTDLSWCWKILATNGGLFKYNTSKEGHWLLSNFAYHDLLSSSSNERGTYFPSEQYDVIFKDKEGYSRGNLNPLLGVSKELFKIIGDISTLMYDSKNHLDQYYNRDQSPFELHSLTSSPVFENEEEEEEDNDDDFSDLSDHGKISRLLLSVIEKSKVVENKIDTCRPDPKDLIGLTDEELELQLTLFEAFQISAKLFLRQSIMKCNPSMLECQVLNNDLIKCIDILVGSPVQASLVFPVFMAGIHSVTKHDRDLMTLRMDNFMKLYGPWNLSRAKYLIEKVWQNNIEGNSVVDWYSILKELGWDINFA